MKGLTACTSATTLLPRQKPLELSASAPIASIRYLFIVLSYGAVEVLLVIVGSGGAKASG
jgi:hypothetical protein